ncbi:MAG: DUF1573 domain-containing protein [bacterium]|jgi:hypothetical protein|nr:DUF1573 domain-containing protein [Planctomycetota bacterium]HIL51066.1 DUF1573 domain-containing protein [Planctomycetota bacterium]
MKPRFLALASLLTLLLAVACSESQEQPQSETAPVGAAVQGDNSSSDEVDLAAQRQEMLAAKAQQAAAAKQAQQARQTKEKAAAQKNKYGLTEEQERQRQVVIDRKAALQADQGKSVAYDGPKGQGPRISVENTQIDFGEVWDTDTMTGSFKFTNTGKQKLIIQFVKASCGCTTTELDRMEFEPGEGSTIHVEWHPKGFGPQIKTITITSNNEGELYTRLMIRATITPFAAFKPEPTRLGNVRLYTKKMAQVELTCVDPDFELLDLRSTNPHLTAVETGRSVDGTRTIELTLDDSAPWGMFNVSVIAKVRGVREPGAEVQERDVLLHVGASIFGDLEVKPNLFSVGRVQPRGRISFSVVLKSADGNDFELTRAVVENSTPPGMTLRSEPLSEGGLRVFVEGEVGDFLGLIRGTAVMETSLAGEGERRLPIMGMVRQ